MRAVAVALALLALLLIACSDSKSDGANATVTSEAAACTEERSHDAGEFEQTIVSNGVERKYILHVPPGYNGTSATPLVLLFHGFALTGRIMLDYAELGPVSDREGFLLVSPTGLGDPPRWNSRALPDDANDLLFVSDLLDKLGAGLCIDQSRTFATGYSNGGGMSMLLSCEQPERFRAVGLVASVFTECPASVPVIAFHGTEDPLLPFEGGGNFPGIRDAVATWATRLGCGATPEVSRQGTEIEYSVYSGCAAGDGAVQLYVVEGKGHTWPGASLLGDAATTTSEINASDLIWQFFAEQP